MRRVSERVGPFVSYFALHLLPTLDPIPMYYREAFFFSEAESEAWEKARNAIARIVAILEQTDGDGPAYVFHRIPSKAQVVYSSDEYLKQKGLPANTLACVARIRLTTHPELTEAQWQEACQEGVLGKPVPTEDDLKWREWESRIGIETHLPFDFGEISLP